MTTTALLRLDNLLKRYGGLTVTDHVSLDLLPNEIHCIIGPNGAGKTTLIGQISGTLASDSGNIYFREQNITQLPTPKRALMGLARSYQITSVFVQFTVLENVVLAAQAHQGHSFGVFSPVLAQPQLTQPALAAIDKAGLSEVAHRAVADLSYGQRRQLELAMVLVSEPAVLLLDEPMAGMSQAESARVVELLRGLKAKHSMLLIEHDMDAVFALADRISVLVYGKIIASGTPDEIRQNADVRTAYLGDEVLH